MSTEFENDQLDSAWQNQADSYAWHEASKASLQMDPYTMQAEIDAMHHHDQPFSQPALLSLPNDQKPAQGPASSQAVPASASQQAENQGPAWPAFTGKVERLYYQKAKSGFCIGALRDEQTKKQIRFKGVLPGAMVGQLWHIEGNWETHKTYGPQLAIYQANPVEKNFDEDLVRFFSSKTFPGVGAKTAEKIVKTLGENAIEIILKDPDVLASQCQLSEKVCHSIREGLSQFGGRAMKIEQLLRWGLEQSDIKKLNTCQDGQIDHLDEDPYWPFYHLQGFGYFSAERIADGLELASTDPKRVEAAVFNQITTYANQTGSTAIRKSLLATASKIDGKALDAALDSLAKRKLIVLKNDFVYQTVQYNCEMLTAALVYVHQFPVESPSFHDIEAKLAQIEKREGIQYDQDQKKAVHTFLNHSMMILNGGPGTGKSTLLKALLEMVRQFYPHARVQLCAPTGRAAKRMNELTNRFSRTIHSLLGWDKEQDKFAYDENKPLNIDFLVVDEMSMVDNRLFASLLRALPSYCRILLIGDEDQLESVGPGNVLRDLIESDKIPVAHLETLHRQKKGSGIPLLANEIRIDQPLHFEDPVTFLEAPGSTLATLESLVKLEDNPADVQILAPVYNGESGIYQINEMMQKIVNPFSPLKPEMSIQITTKDGPRTVIYRQDDKVLLKANMAELDIYNGDIGTILSVDPMTKSLICGFNGIEVEFERSALSSYITHAWCISIHKSQGSEYPNVCVIADGNGRSMLKKRLIYTAISRSKKKLSIIGNEADFRQCALRKDDATRQTTLQLRLAQYWQYAAKKAETAKKQVHDQNQGLE